MKENIESKHIGNRKFIIELRFSPKVILLDRRGQIVEKIQESKVFQHFHWEIGQSDVTIRNTPQKEEATCIATITLNRLNFNCFSISTVESFYADFIKIYEAVVNVIGKLDVIRIGCRIMGTYYTKSLDYETVLNKFKVSFPAKFLIDKYPAKDFLFHLVYTNGMYEIGPLSGDDNFFNREFNVPNCKKHVGVAIDTDNFLTNETKEINDKSLIKDVYMLSLSVEKDLFSNLKDF